MRIINFDKLPSKPTKAQIEFIKKHTDIMNIKKLTFETATQIISDVIASWDDNEWDNNLDEYMNGDELYGG